MKKTLCVFVCIIAGTLFPQQGEKRTSGVFVDSSGVMRWNGTQQEVSFFGVNYTTPFAYAYRAHKRLGLSLKNAIDLDVAQMKRLGFDAFRVHVWEKEITDSVGNLLKNEHLDLFDYLLSKLSENGIKSIITPVAWWGTGWPEPDIPTAGYTRNTSKGDLITNPIVRQAQRRYLKQFVDHINPYKKVSYKDDLDIIAFEIVNEPRHPDSAAQVTDYINEMAEVLRSVGLQKPIFYNISETWSDVQAAAVTKANVDGVTFQWYPTSLVHGSMLRGNFLINVNRYAIPSADIQGYASKAKMVYEFDAADIGGSYMYPAMARSFREAGMQFAAMFSYDPTQIAWSNTEYPTHFLNLLYTPSKAISLMIAGKAFRSVPRMQSYGNHPANSRFEDVRVSYEEDLSELNSETDFYYSNTTSTIPKNSSAVQHIAGTGSSPLVHYDGTGAYFLDKKDDGVWRMEVYPDAMWIRDPFEQGSMTKQVSRLFWNERMIQLNIPDLGDTYELKAMSTSGKVKGNSITPGVYLVVRKSDESKKKIKQFLKKEQYLEGLFTPAGSRSSMYVVNNSRKNSLPADPASFEFLIAGEKKITNAHLFVKRFGWRGYAKLWLKNTGGFRYVPADTPKVLQPGIVDYCVAVESDGKVCAFPEEIQNDPGNWDFSTRQHWQMSVQAKEEPVVLFDAQRDRKDLLSPNYSRALRSMVDYETGPGGLGTAIALSATFTGASPLGFSCQIDISKTVVPFTDDLQNYRYITLKARAVGDSVRSVNVNLLTRHGEAFGAVVTLSDTWKEVSIPLSAMKRTECRILPDSYPLFLEKTWNNGGEQSGILDIEQVMSLQIVIPPDQQSKEIRLKLSSISLTK